MSRKSRKKSNGSNNSTELINAIIDLFANHPTQAFNYKQVAKRLHIKQDSQRARLMDILAQLAQNEELEEVSPGKYKLLSKTRYITGTLQLTSSNNAFVISDEVDEEVFIAFKNLNHALGGDKVRVYLYAKRPGRRLEGEVVEVLERKRKQFVGRVEVTKNFAFLVPDSKDIPYDIFIPLNKLNKAKNGQKAVARITDWPDHVKNPFGEIVEVLGAPGKNETEIHAILAEFELPYRFPDEVIREAEKIPEHIPAEEIKKRRDFRKITTFTIDPIDAKDFDDAISFQILPNGNYEIGIHIADVTYYVKPGSLIDEEAYKRGTSVYLVDRVVPMLPEKLSNHVCSLRPNEDKLCYSAVFEMDTNARVINQWIGRTIINSDRRFNYEEAQQIIETGQGDFADILQTLDRLAKILRQERMKKGAIEFDRLEPKFELDDEGRPLKVYFKENKDSNKLIEEFMLLANRNVAELIGKKLRGRKAPTFVYRIHDKPNEQKLTAFADFVKNLGYKISTANARKTAESINSLLLRVKGKNEEGVIENLALRAMAKAEYSTQNIGHYGLAFEHYTHFTSPIRRYPDMLVHRLLDHYLHEGTSKDKNKYEKMCKHASDMERRATEAERASIKYKQVEFMSNKIGKVYDGIISGVTEWGIYVEIKENLCEGMIPIRELDDDFYYFDEEKFCLIGKRYGRKFQIGDTVKIKVWRTNLLKKQIDFRLYEE